MTVAGRLIGSESVVLGRAGGSIAYRAHDTVRERTLEITFLEPGAEAYVFTFA